MVDLSRNSSVSRDSKTIVFIHSTSHPPCDMSQLANHVQVSLHPVASRHGTASSTTVSVPLQHQAHNKPSGREDAQRTPRLQRSSPEQQRSRPLNQRSPSPKSLPQAARLLNAEPPTYGIHHADLEQYPVIYNEPFPSDSSTDDDDDDDDGDDTIDNASTHKMRRDQFGVMRWPCPSKRKLAAPIRAMSAEQLALLYEQYVAQDVPHSVVFPYLHGVDGSVPAQNRFFGAPWNGQPTPAYRGLTILRADMPTPQEIEQMFASRATQSQNCSRSRSRSRTFSSVTTQCSSSSPDTDDDSVRFEPNGADSFKSASGLAGPMPFPTPSTASISPSTASTVSSQMSRPSLFSVTSESCSSGSRTSVSTVSDTADDYAPLPTKHLHLNRSARYEKQPFRSLLNSTVYPIQIIKPPSICRTLQGHQYPSSLFESNYGDHNDGTQERRVGASFVNPPQASSVSLRNFGIQCAKYATISDIVIYCPLYHPGVLTLAKWVREAQASLRKDRLSRGWGGLQYNVFVVTESFEVFEQRFPWLISVDSNGLERNGVSFRKREREEMERMTHASEIHDNVWLSCTADAPDADDSGSSQKGSEEDSAPVTPDEQANPHCISISIKCQEQRYGDSSDCTPEALRSMGERLDSVDASMRIHSDTDKLLDSLHRDHVLHLDRSSLGECIGDGLRNPDSRDGSIVLGPNGWTPKARSVPVSTDASASHLVQAKSSSASLGQDTDRSGRDLLRLDASAVVQLDFVACSGGVEQTHTWQDTTAKKLVDLCTWIHQQASPRHRLQSGRDAPAFTTSSSTLRTFRNAARSPDDGRERSHTRAEPCVGSARRSRRVLLHCFDGYTETSVLALSYLMYARQLSLPEAYLDLHLRADRSFFVYPTDIPVLKAVERLLQQERMVRRQSMPQVLDAHTDLRGSRVVVSKPLNGSLGADGRHSETGGTLTPTPSKGRISDVKVNSSELVGKHAWFDSCRFDGSFPSRILPFLYLGSLDDASNVDMLRVLGITHLVSVGETALEPPVHISANMNASGKAHRGSRYQRASAKEALAEDATSVPSCTYQSQGITVLNVRNVSDDGIDSLRGTMREAVQFIESARLSGGKVLVHCRVGVSRSTTVVLAYVMAHLDLGLMESYLLVRSRRLNIVIQPHLLFLWELRGWETFLFRAKQTQIELVRGRVGSAELARGELSPGSNAEVSSAGSSQCSEEHLAGVEIGAGAGSVHGIDRAHTAMMPFGSGSPIGLPYNASRLTWGFFAREIDFLNLLCFI